MKFEDIDGVLHYIMSKTEGVRVDFEKEKLEKTLSLLKKFVHNPKVTSPEIKSYNTDSLRAWKERHPRNKIGNQDAYSIELFDFDYNVVYFVEFGDIHSNNSFAMEIDMVRMTEHEIKSNTEAVELLKEYNREVEYDTMNDAWNYHRQYHSMQDRKAERNSEIVKMFKNFKIY